MPIFATYSNPSNSNPFDESLFIHTSDPFIYSAENDKDTEFLLFDFNDFSVPLASVNTMYKPVAKKIQPIPGVYPEEARTRRSFPEDPLLSLPPLSPNPPEFVPSKRLTLERLQSLEINNANFLLPEEEKLFNHIMLLNQHTLAFEETDRGTLKEEYFSPYIIPTVEHIPWVKRNIPIPPGILHDVIKLLKDKIAAGVYEPSQSSY